MLEDYAHLRWRRFTTLKRTASDGVYKLTFTQMFCQLLEQLSGETHKVTKNRNMKAFKTIFTIVAILLSFFTPRRTFAQGTQSGWSQSGSPNGPTDTNYWVQLDQLSQSQGGSAAIVGSPYSSVQYDTYILTNGGNISLQYWVGIATAGMPNAAFDNDVYTTNPISTDIYVVCWSGLGGYSTNGMDNFDISTLTLLQNTVGTDFFAFLRRNGDGSPNPLDSVPQIWGIDYSTGPYAFPQNAPTLGYANPFPIGAFGGIVAPIKSSNCWVFYFTNV